MASMPTMTSSSGAPSHSLLNKGMDREEVRAGSFPKQAAPPSWDYPLSLVLIYQPEHPTVSPCSKDSVSHAGVESRATTSWHHSHCICPKPKAYPRLVRWWLSSRPSGSEFLGHVPSLTTLWAILLRQVNVRDGGPVPWWGRSLGPLEKGMGTHSSVLAWRIPWIEESGGLQSMQLQKVGHN